MAAKRKSIPKKTRFEVFKRDKFTCQYCGIKAPEVVLVVDHVNPVAEGGDNSILNLISACIPCNAGKGAVPLSDASALEKQREQLEQLQERREQLDMMLEWQRGLSDLAGVAVDEAADIWRSLLDRQWSLNERGRNELRRLISKHGLQCVLDAMRESTSKHLEYDEQNKVTCESVIKAWEFVAKIARFEKRVEGKPYLRELLYIRGIVRNRFSYCNQQLALSMMEEAYLSGVHIESLRRVAVEANNWTDWRNTIDELIAAESDGAT